MYAAGLPAMQFRNCRDAFYRTQGNGKNRVFLVISERSRSRPRRPGEYI